MCVLSNQGDGQVTNWDRELPNALTTSAGEAWLNPASESEESSKSGSEPRADRGIPRLVCVLCIFYKHCLIYVVDLRGNLLSLHFNNCF